jgi:peptidoglycan/xylan/chitin deacetylase (PgdA/CDA1 family)
LADTLILCYHAVSEDWRADLALPQQLLERQLSLLARLGYRGVTFEQAVVDGSAGRRVAVTFDDCFRSVLDLAFPVLSAIGWPATVFVVTDFGDGEGPLRWPGIDKWLGTDHEHELAAMSWEQLGRLKAAGWEVGSHTCSHPRLTELSPSAAEHELEDSRLICERQLGAPCVSVAYPYGDVNQDVVAAARRSGYRYGAGLPARPHPARPLEWPRVGVYNVDRLWRFVLKVAPVSRWIRTREAAGHSAS